MRSNIKAPMKKKSSPTKKKVVARKPIRRVVVKSVGTSHAKTHKKTILRLGFSMRSLHIGMHLVIAVSAVGVLFALGAVDRARFATLLSDAAPANTSTVGLVHQNPLLLSVTFARKIDGGYASFKNGSNETVSISLPYDWTLQEVSGASLDTVQAGAPTFGFTTRALPAGATLKLSMRKVPDHLFIDSVSQSTVAVSFKTVDLTGDSATAKAWVKLIRGNNLVGLWEAQ